MPPGVADQPVLQNRLILSRFCRYTSRHKVYNYILSPEGGAGPVEASRAGLGPREASGPRVLEDPSLRARTRVLEDPSLRARAWSGLVGPYGPLTPAKGLLGPNRAPMALLP